MAQVCHEDSPTVSTRQELGADGALILDTKVDPRGGVKLGPNGLSVGVSGGIRTLPVGPAMGGTSPQALLDQARARSQAGLFTGGGGLDVRTMAFWGQGRSTDVNGAVFPTGYNALTDPQMVGGTSAQSAASGSLTLKTPITSPTVGTMTNDTDRSMWVFFTVSHPGRVRLTAGPARHWNVYPALAMGLSTDPINWFEYSVIGTRNTGVSLINSGGTDTFWAIPRYTGLVNLLPGQTVVLRQRYHLLWNIALGGSHVELPAPLVTAYGVSFA